MKDNEKVEQEDSEDRPMTVEEVIARIRAARATRESKQCGGCSNCSCGKKTNEPG